MSNGKFNFNIPSGSSIFGPATPDRKSTNLFRQTTTSNSSTTPAGAPPSSTRGLFDSTNTRGDFDDDDLGNVSTASFTPAGAPSAKYLGSSIMRGLGSSNSGPQPKGLFTTGGGTQPKGLFTSGESSQPKGLFTNGEGSSQPKGLFTTGGETKAKGLFTSGESQPKGLFTSGESSQPKGLFTSGAGSGNSGLFTGIGGGLDTAAGFSGSNDTKKNLFASSVSQKKSPLARAPVRGPPRTRQPSRLSRSIAVDELSPQPQTRTFGVPLDEEGDSEGAGDGDDEEGDMWLDMPSTAEQDPDAEQAEHSDGGSDLMMMATPAALERVRQEAEDIYRASSFQAGNPTRAREFRYAALAKDQYEHMGVAPLTEPPHIILGTENLLAKLYDEGVGEADNEEKLDDTLASVAAKVAQLWKSHVDTLPLPPDDNVAVVGPGPNATPFEKAHFLANLVLQIHHTRYDDGGGDMRPEPLPETLFRWLGESHELYSGQVDQILRHRPSPACHSLFWAAVFMALLRGRVADAARLLRQAGWAHVRHDQSGEYIYTGRALDNVERAVDHTVSTLESCPGYDDNWDIWSSDWTLFRVRAQGALEQLRRFAEGKDTVFNESTSSARSSTAANRQSMAGLARRAESQVPWEIYEKLNVLFDIVLGQEDAILEAAQDWLEATIGLFGWWDERRSSRAADSGKFAPSRSLSRSQALVLASEAPVVGDSESYLDRLAHVFHMAVESDFHFDSQNPVEIGMACAFEGNVKGVIGLLRAWSLPVAAAVAEIASLGKWLPPHQPQGVYALEDLDENDLELLGMGPPTPDEVDGIKDSTLVQYAQALAEYEGLSAAREGWELSMSVLGRMDSPERSEEMVRDLVEHLVKHLHVDSGAMVDRLWGMLNELGMTEFAEDTAETYGDVLARDSHRYGEAMWYYALAHKPNKVREVMNLLISYSLVQSTAFPPTHELDDYLRRLLTDRKNTLEQCASQDMDAAELLGKMLSGYASLRQFYDIRDNDAAMAHVSPRTRRQQAATALVSVIASSDDNIRGGLLDQTRDGIVSEDFLLALLGEALVFVSDPDKASDGGPFATTPILTLDQIDVLLKAVEDLQAVSSRVYTICDEFLQLVLASAPGGLKGSTPADLLRKSSGPGNFTLAGSSLVASQLQKSLSGASGALGKAVTVKRGWDWRSGVSARTKGEDILKRLRLGLARDLAGLWVAEADDLSW
ncbi:hypothetical protein VTJ04DRAFT_10095 [Mycothermus thermophilus]|uniref:uncharacterized protein n=1 Tax=Humicola insolens TaxID=85995 RepID=UPI0037424D95